MKFPQPQKLNKTYIVPTIYGFAFAVLVIVMLFMAFIYMNNLIYGAVFFVSSLSIQNMVRTAKNVESFEARLQQLEPLFALEKGQVDLKVSSSKVEKTYFISLLNNLFEKEHVQIEESSKDQIKTQRVDIIPPRRGELFFGKARIQSEFPFGFFKSWKYIELNEALWVYPQRKGHSLSSRYHYSLLNSSHDEFLNHEEFKNNSSLSRIDWKVYSRTQELYVRKYAEETRQNTELKWDDVQDILSFEDKLSQLSLWIWECHEHNLEYSLTLPHKIFFKNKGSHHFNECMKELAQWNPH